MRPVAPRIEGAEEITIAEDQLEYLTIVGAYVTYKDSDRTDLVVRWTFTAEERKRIAAGEDIYFGTVGGGSLNPHWLQVGFP
jgi:hypothetical protein